MKIGKLRIKWERDESMLRVWWNWVEVAYLVFAIRGLRLEVEFPSDWHDARRAWFRFGFGLVSGAVSIPWPWVVPDEYQCSGPTYGFSFFESDLHLHWGKCKGMRDDPVKLIAMPWQWRHREHHTLTEPQAYPYRYHLRSGEVQERTATVIAHSRRWSRPWFPHQRVEESITVDFDKEVGERSGSWKGGVTGCGYEMQAGETPEQALRRMERERTFA